ncbi:TolC family protein [Roseivirga echinicomitans]
MKGIKHYLLYGLLIFLLAKPSVGQESQPINTKLSLEQILDYALKNSPMIQQSLLDEEIGERQIKSNLSGWLPQVSADFGASHNIKQQSQIIGNQLVTFGQKYNSNLLFKVNQNLFSRDQFFASKTKGLVRSDLDQNTESNKVNTVVMVSKAYYDILLTFEQREILDENLGRLQKQYQDAKSRYESGLVDKTDFQRAAISLSNLKSDRNRVATSLDAKFAYLKQLMGFPTENDLSLEYDYAVMEGNIEMDTTTALQVEKRIEYQQLETQISLMSLQTRYQKWSFIPEVSAFYNYNMLFFDNQFSDLYKNNYPTSAVGLSAGIPIFQGTKRTQEIKIAELKEERIQLDKINLKNQINTEYAAAMAAYKSNLFEWKAVKENMELAEEVYNIIKLQYDEGIKAYVDLIVAETELRTSQLNHYNALYMVLASKLDLKKALGNIEIN